MRMKLLTSAALAATIGAAAALAQQPSGAMGGSQGGSTERARPDEQQPRQQRAPATREDQGTSRAQTQQRDPAARGSNGRDEQGSRAQTQQRNEQPRAQDRQRPTAQDEDRPGARDGQQRPRTGQAPERDRPGGTTQSQQRGANQPADSNRAGSRTEDPTRSGANERGTTGRPDAATGAAQNGRQPGQTQPGQMTGQTGERGGTSAGARTEPGGRDSGTVSVEQRTRIREAFSRDDLGPATNVNFSVSVGATVPTTVRRRPLPASIVSIVPQYRDYEYVVVRDEIVIIEPRTRRVVEVIERSGPRTTGSVGARARISLDDREKRIIKRLATEGSAPKAATSITIERGAMLPDSVEIVTVPETIVSEVPELRTYRYVLVGERIAVIEPDSREIVEIVE